jgi:hypothetical protein
LKKVSDSDQSVLNVANVAILHIIDVMSISVFAKVKV